MHISFFKQYTLQILPPKEKHDRMIQEIFSVFYQDLHLHPDDNLYTLYQYVTERHPTIKSLAS